MASSKHDKSFRGVRLTNVDCSSKIPIKEPSKAVHIELLKAAMTSVSIPLPPTNKRKRPSNDQDAGRYVKQQTMNGNNLQTSADSFVDVQQMLQGIDQHTMSAPDDSTRTAQAALATPMQPSSYPEPSSYQGTPGMQQGYDDTPGGPAGMSFGTDQRSGSGSKPQVGSTEWHQQRKDNHKEVERRRREVINEGIENIAKVVPNVEKNKGAILSRTCQYIGELQAKERQFETERATFEVALKELTGRIERLRESSQSAWAESAKWQQRCRNAGLHFDDYDDGALATLGEDAGDEES